MTFQAMRKYGLCLVLSQQYGMTVPETYSCLDHVFWDVGYFRHIADSCHWEINPRIFKRKAYASTLLLRDIVERRGTQHRHV